MTKYDASVFLLTQWWKASAQEKSACTVDAKERAVRLKAACEVLMEANNVRCEALEDEIYRLATKHRDAGPV